MTAASRSLATALRTARFASGLLPQSYTTTRDATLLVQIGVLDPKTLPVSGAEQARRLLNPHEPANELIARSLPAKQ
jgi:carboxymethylenebutenolidase